MTFYLGLTVNRIYRCEALMNLRCIRRQIPPTPKKTKNQQSCLPLKILLHSPRKPWRRPKDMRIAIKLRMKVGFPAWAVFTKLAFLFTQLCCQTFLEHRQLPTTLSQTLCDLRNPHQLTPKMKLVFLFRNCIVDTIHRLSQLLKWNFLKVTRRRWKFCGCESERTSNVVKPKFLWCEKSLKRNLF